MSVSNLDDIQLLQLLREGSHEAFAEIYLRNWKRVYTVALSYLKSAEAAEDVVQEIFVKIWMNKEKLTEIRELKPYLFATARNFIISSLRNKVFHVSLDPEEHVEERMFLPERQLSYKDSLEMLQKAIALLPPQQQKAYKLSRNEGMRYEKIAEDMGISKLTVRTHLTKALAFIRRYLNDQGIHPLVIIFTCFAGVSNIFFAPLILFSFSCVL